MLMTKASSFLRQADEILPPRIMQLIGAARTYAARINFFLAVPNTLMIAVLFYQQSPLVQSVIPTVYHWVALILFGIVPAAVLCDRMLLHPAQIIYQHHQGARENRSPNFRETMENQREIKRIHDRLDRIETGDSLTTDN